MNQNSEPQHYPLTFKGETIGYAYAGSDGQLHGVITDTEVAAKLSRINTQISISLQEPTK